MIVQPLVNRELLREGRRLSHFVSRTLFVLALSVIFVWAYALYSRFGSQPTPSAMARLGAELFTVWALVLYVGLILFATVRAAGLADEHRTGSLPLARITGLGDSGVIFGWFLSVMGRSLTGMILTLPVLAMVRTCGGFTTPQLLATAALIFFAAAIATALTLLIAARSQSTGGAVITSLVVQVLILLLISVVWKDIMRSSITAFTGNISLFLRNLEEHSQHTYTLLWQLTRHSLRTRFTIILLIAFAARAGMVLVLLLFAMLAIRRGPRKGRSLAKRFFLRMDRFFLELQNNKWVLWKAGLGPCKGNPVLWRERAASMIGNRDHMIRFWYIALICTGPIAPFLILFVFLIVTPATAFARERGSNTITLLAATPLSAKEIVRGKYLFTMRRLAIPLALIALGIILLYISNPYAGVKAILPQIAFFLLIPLVAAQILYVCAGARTTAGGIIMSAVMMGIWAGGIALIAKYGIYRGMELIAAYETYGQNMARTAIPPIVIQLIVALFTAILCLGLERYKKLANSLLLCVFIAYYLCLHWLFDQQYSMAAILLVSTLVFASIVIPLFVYIRLHIHVLHAGYKTLLRTIALPLAVALLCMGKVPHTLFAMFMLAILAWRAMPYAREGGVNRIILSMISVLPLFLLLPYMGLGYRGYYNHFLIFAAIAIWITLAIIFILEFPRTLAAQLDQIMQRNETTLAPEPTEQPPTPSC